MTYLQSDQAPPEETLPTRSPNQVSRDQASCDQVNCALALRSKGLTKSSVSSTAAKARLPLKELRRDPAQKKPGVAMEDDALQALRQRSSFLPAPAKIDILGMDFDNFSMEEFLGSLRRGVVFTPNVDHLMKLRTDPEFASVYSKADFKICDSQIVMYAAKFLGKPLKAKLSGSDLFPWFCDYHKHNEDVTIFLLGGQPGVAKQAQARINARIGREIVVGEYSPPLGFEQDGAECDQMVSLIERSQATVVAVCLGAPKQEKWIAAYCDRLPSVDIFMAVGAVVDFEAGVKPRAPRFVSELGLEWLYRLMSEPRRLWRRYLLEDMPFVGLVLTEKLKQIVAARNRRLSYKRLGDKRLSNQQLKRAKKRGKAG
ncbi:MAG: WecB/TagA/CpsF family glycosyltransferase [Phormidesmis sp.]